MTDHLPECPYVVFDQQGQIPATVIPGRCICRALRACEQRVRNQDIATRHADLQEAKALLASRDEAWYAGVDAAREAVEAVDPPSEAYDDWHPKGKRLALAAIDALREEKK